MTTPTEALAQLGLTHPTATALLDVHANDPAPVRRQAAADAIIRRRDDLGLLAVLLRERDGRRAPSLEDLLRTDTLLVELTTLAVA